MLPPQFSESKIIRILHRSIKGIPWQPRVASHRIRNPGNFRGDHRNSFGFLHFSHFLSQKVFLFDRKICFSRCKVPGLAV